MNAKIWLDIASRDRRMAAYYTAINLQCIANNLLKSAQDAENIARQLIAKETHE